MGDRKPARPPRILLSSTSPPSYRAHSLYALVGGVDGLCARAPFGSEESLNQAARFCWERGPLVRTACPARSSLVVVVCTSKKCSRLALSAGETPALPAGKDLSEP